MYNEEYEMKKKPECESKPLLVNVEQAACRNLNFRSELWTGKYLQMTLMCIPVNGEIGMEMHKNNDQFIRVEQGTAVVIFGDYKDKMAAKHKMCCGDAIFVPAGTWHNVINTGNTDLKISSIYAPPHHPKGTVHRTKEDSDRANY